MLISNENLTKNIFTFLSMKDIANLELVNTKTLALCANFNWKWREECNDYFYSNCEYLDVINKKSYEHELQYTEYLRAQKDDISWKDLYKRGINNRKEFHNFRNHEFQYISEDLISIDDISYSALKDHLALPQIRKEYLHLENDMTSSHQTFSLDFLKQQVELFDYYDNFFKYDTWSKNNNTVRRDDLPLAELLRNVADVFTSLMKDDCQKKEFLAHRWYEDLGTMPPLNNNPINFILGNFYQKVKIFCEITVNYIKKYCFDEHSNGTYTKRLENVLNELYCNEYVKRYKSFCDASEFLNDHLENVNVIVNYLYDNFYPSHSDMPKFSIYRMMITIWNREVLKRQQKGLLTAMKRLIYSYVTTELKPMDDIYWNSYIRCSGSSIKTTSRRSSDMNVNPFHIVSNQQSARSSLNANSNSSSYSILLQFRDIDASDLQNSNSANENTKYFIEQICCSILDMSCNEQSVFFINHTNMKTNTLYDELEQVISDTLINSINDCLGLKSLEKEAVVEFMNNFNEEKGLRFINRTKILLIKSMVKNIVEACWNDLAFIFSEFLQKSSFSQSEVENFYKTTRITRIENSSSSSYDNLISNDIQALEVHLAKIANALCSSNHTDHNLLAQFSLDYFMREINKTNHKCMKMIRDCLCAYYAEADRLDRIDRKVTKECKKMDIMLNIDEEMMYLLSYDNDNKLQLINEICELPKWNDSHSYDSLSSTMPDDMALD